MNPDLKPGVLASAALGILLLAFALSLDFPKVSGGGFKSDEATYYVLGHSLARDFDFTFEHNDLKRVWEEFQGPQGIFLKRGKSIDIQGAREFPFVRWVKLEDPQRDTRLYYAKSYIYPLVAAPFIVLFGTNGFLVLHALLMSLNLFVAYVFVNARTKSSWVALPLAAVFLAASVVPVYFVWLMPELFNFSLTLYALFFWSYKEVAAERFQGKPHAFLMSQKADVLAAALIGVATFSKPTHLLLIFPVAALAASRRQWKHAVTVVAAWGAVTALLFALNAVVTGEFNYQGGDRKTFYHYTGFPFANTWETFDNIGPVRGREDMMVGDVLVNTHSFTVFRHNLLYFFAGRYSGLVPYFFPGMLLAALFVISRRQRPWQWLIAATAVGAILMHLIVWPFTYNGGGGPVGNRYFLSFYPLFLFLAPATAGLGSAVLAFLVGALFTAKIVLNPFYSSTNPGEHAKSGPLRALPIDLTLINDLPVAQNADRRMQRLGGTPPVFAYFPDDYAYNPEGEWFWVKGKSRTDVVLRAPVANAGQNEWISKTIPRLQVEIRNSGVANRITVSTGRESQTLDMQPSELRRISLAVRAGVPYRRDIQPTSYLYTLWVSTTDGFIPFLDVPCGKPGTCAADNRFLGAMIHVIPEYTDADISTWSVAPGMSAPGKDETGGLRDTP